MNYEEALRIGKVRADCAANALQQWTGIKAMSLCAVKPGKGSDYHSTGSWEPVGQQSFKEIVRYSEIQGNDTYDLIIVDESGSVKAYSAKKYPLDEVLKLVNRLPLPVAMEGYGLLWKHLHETAQIEVTKV